MWDEKAATELYHIHSLDSNNYYHQCREKHRFVRRESRLICISTHRTYRNDVFSLSHLHSAHTIYRQQITANEHFSDLEQYCRCWTIQICRKEAHTHPAKQQRMQNGHKWNNADIFNKVNATAKVTDPDDKMCSSGQQMRANEHKKSWSKREELWTGNQFMYVVRIGVFLYRPTLAASRVGPMKIEWMINI